MCFHSFLHLLKEVVNIGLLCSLLLPQTVHWPALQLPLQQSPGAVQASPPGKQEPQRNIPPVVVVVDCPPPAEEVEVEESAWLPTHWSVTSEQGYWQVYSQLAITQVAPQG